MISFVTHTIRPWIVRLEKSISKHLMSEEDRRRGLYAEFLVDGLLRGDIKSRYEAYALAIQNLWMNPNEARAKENMPPRDGGDEFANPNITAGQENDGETDIQEQ
jgi:HK97 family phage portal protein